MKHLMKYIDWIVDFGTRYATLIIAIGLLISVLINNYRSAVIIALVGILIKLEKFDE